MLDLNHYSGRLKLKVSNEKRFIWDIIRKKWLVLQPEEFVRQVMILYLIDNGYPIGKMTVERSIKGIKKYNRFDLLVYDSKLTPYLLIECKSFEEKLKEDIDIQIGSYNDTLKSPFICISNGITTHFFKRNENHYEKLEGIPEYFIKG